MFPVAVVSVTFDESHARLLTSDIFKNILVCFVDSHVKYDTAVSESEFRCLALWKTIRKYFEDFSVTG